jgi:hypothetical protein
LHARFLSNSYPTRNRRLSVALLRWPAFVRCGLAEAVSGPRRIDKLVEVRRFDGTEQWLLIHFEVQIQRDVDLLPRRGWLSRLTTLKT